MTVDYLTFGLVHSMIEKEDKLKDEEILDRGRRIADEVGLKLDSFTNGYSQTVLCYHAKDIYRILGQSVEVFNYKSGKFGCKWTPNHVDGDNEKALLIAIRPLVPEKVESDAVKLLRELVERLSNFTLMSPETERVVERAKALIEKERMK